ncbi:MAG: iron ABC transporter permease [Deferribacteres bacterium]|nr:iron ABC transporter permease [candidate division KSB1 bacterium]MCB9510819.1 iron ABC transporter permease [Deferribacteres bacterium]
MSNSIIPTSLKDKQINWGGALRHHSARWLAILLLVLMIIYPLALMVQQSLLVDGQWSLANYIKFLSPNASRSLTALWGSVWLSLASAFFAALIGVPLALLFERFELPAKQFLSAIATLPIVLPPLVGVVAFLFLAGESGMLPRLLQAIFKLDAPPFYLRGVSAIIVVHAYSFYVYFFLFTRAAFKRLDGATIEAARSLSASNWRIYWQVILPQLRPSISAAAILVFMISMASFSAPFIFPGDYRVLTVEIYNNKLQGDMPMAITQSVMLGMISIAFLYLNLRGEQTMVSTGQKGVPLPPRPLKSRQSRILAGVLALVATFTLALPHLTLLLISFVKNGSWTTQILPDTFTLENFVTLITASRAADPVINSAKMAVLATSLNILFAVIFAYWHTQKRRISGKWSEAMIMLPWAIPGTVVAIALIVTFNKPHWFTGGAILVGTFWLLPLAYFIRHLPVVYRASHAAFLQFDRSHEEAARSLGGGNLLVFRRVVLPAIWPGVIAGALLAMVMSLGEFVSSILIYTFSNRPISVAILGEIRLYNLGSAAAYGVMLTIMIFLVTWLSARWSELR